MALTRRKEADKLPGEPHPSRAHATFGEVPVGVPPLVCRKN